MTKQDAIKAFGSGAALGRALGVTRGAVSLWPEQLDQTRADRVRGAAVRLGIALPEAARVADIRGVNAQV
ncbi:hypothetical protein D0838_04980 [Bordetella avium]|uniref:Cro/CI family transcriptional regulator n=1 Tax=Bordetella avium TaxID=521 RepID=UPI000E698A57|nr:Cro/CI family transcriptional regulator [Bordetella avium]RIQ74555.1 hypothetical protein D0838_04980 [Bordetella avium]